MDTTKRERTEFDTTRRRRPYERPRVEETGDFQRLQDDPCTFAQGGGFGCSPPGGTPFTS
jgi:hypothetical protein